MARRASELIGVGLAVALLAGACDGTAEPSISPTTSASPTDTPSDGGRVDLGEPTFSDSTSITNPLFPISQVDQVIQLGEEASESLRIEVTLLPDTRTIEWKGQRVEAAVSQFVAYLDGRIAEVALDYFAQADDGAVWYFGEEVDNYEDGQIADHEGAWLAGRDGPPGMIMPADPEVGDVYRPENIPDLVFEEVTVQAVGEAVDGPTGPVEGAVLVEEHLMDGTIEHKVFAPGYGEFEARAEDELVTVALAVPTDALTEPPPVELVTLATRATDVFDAANDGGWRAVSAALGHLTEAWKAYRAADVPELLQAQMTEALEALARSIDWRKAAGACRAALDVAGAALDLQLRHGSPGEVDLGRLGLWARRITVDAATGDAAAVAGDVASLETIWDRVDHTIGPAEVEPIEGRLENLRAAAEAGDLTTAVDVASGLLEALPAL
jgi:hypothetical protein